MSLGNRLLLWSVLLATIGCISAQDKAEPKYEMTTYQWVFFVRGANHPALSDTERETMQKGHIANLERLGREGKGTRSALAPPWASPSHQVLGEGWGR